LHVILTVNGHGKLRVRAAGNYHPERVSNTASTELVVYDSRAKAGRMRYCVAKAKITAIKMTRRDVRTAEAIFGEDEMSSTKGDETTHIAQWWVSV
jgi:hypothetical protein